MIFLLIVCLYLKTSTNGFCLREPCIQRCKMAGMLTGFCHKYQGNFQNCFKILSILELMLLFLTRVFSFTFLLHAINIIITLQMYGHK